MAEIAGKLGTGWWPLAGMIALLLSLLAAVTVNAGESDDYALELTTAHSGYDRETCWVHARAGAVPPHAAGNPSDNPIVVMTTQKLLLDRSDVFYGLHDLRSDDLGRTWSQPEPQPTLKRRRLDEHREVVICDFTPQWHAASGKLLGTGLMATYRDNRLSFPLERQTAYSSYDFDRHAWSQWETLEMPDVPQFRSSGAGCTQRYDLPGGEILLPIAFVRTFGEPVTRVTVVRCRFDGQKLTYLGQGDDLAIDTDRGLVEPSLTHFGERYYLTIRHDARGYVTAGNDGLHYEALRVWKFDDGEELGNYNTQQHWVTHSDGLYLVYTRRGAENDHIFRHRAPLFMAKVDPKRLCVIRSTEQAIVPQRGARLGNFGIVDVSPSETWVIVAEWMQSKTDDPTDCEKYGSDNSIFVAKLHWRQPNRLVSWQPAGSLLEQAENQDRP